MWVAAINHYAGITRVNWDALSKWDVWSLISWDNLGMRFSQYTCGRDTEGFLMSPNVLSPDSRSLNWNDVEMQLFFFFPGCTLGIWKFPGQEAKPCHRQLQPVPQLWQHWILNLLHHMRALGNATLSCPQLLFCRTLLGAWPFLVTSPLNSKWPVLLRSRCPSWILSLTDSDLDHLLSDNLELPD